jgi:hypothetical protein
MQKKLSKLVEPLNRFTSAWLTLAFMKTRGEQEQDLHSQPAIRSHLP